MKRLTYTKKVPQSRFFITLQHFNYTNQTVPIEKFSGMRPLKSFR